MTDDEMAMLRRGGERRGEGRGEERRGGERRGERRGEGGREGGRLGTAVPHVFTSIRRSAKPARRSVAKEVCFTLLF
jgi:hypothetical protein